MQEIVLHNKSLITLVDDADYEWLVAYRWYASTHGSRGQFCAATGKSTKLMHRLILGAPRHLFVDHINGDPLDNQRMNLRLCTRQQNGMNRRSVSNKFGVKGVYKNGPARFMATIRINGQKVYLGTYGDIRLAAEAYDCAARRYFGEYAATNADLNLNPT